MKDDETSFFSKQTLETEATKRWHKENTTILHRVDGPGVERSDGTREWWENGKRHRLDGPAIEYASGYQAWYKNGKLHRIGGPAVERSDGTREWWENGKRHRLNEPAIEWANGGREWWEHGKPHRLDGPAVERADGYQEWWVNGVYLEGLDLDLYLKASNRTSLPSVLSELSRHKNRIIAQAAARNPNCPIEDQIEWVLSPQR